MKAEARILRLLQSAVQQHQAGDLPRAEALCREVLHLDPTHPDALNLLGIVANRQGRHERAAELIRGAIKRHPAAPTYHINLGNALQELGRLQEAADSFETALRLDPKAIEAWTNLGNLRQKRGDSEAAIADYRRALALRPLHANALRGLGKALSEMGRLPESVEAYQRALAVDPNDENSLAGLAAILPFVGRINDAVQCSERLLALAPRRHDYLIRHSGLLQQTGQAEAARRCAVSAVELAPTLAESHNQLGWVLTSQDRFSEALAAFRRSVELQSGYATPLTNESLVLWRMGRGAEAAAAARRASEVAPDDDLARSNYLMFSNYDPGLSPQFVFQQHQAWGAARHRAMQGRPRTFARRGPEERLRIGYVSGDFRMHSVGFFMEPLLECHDRSRFEVYCYSNSISADAKTRRLADLADHWRIVAGVSDQHLAEQVARDGIDILIDLAGHTSDGRLGVFLRRAAPVQVTYLGYPNTTGVPAMDYRITDDIADPPGVSDALNVERLVRLPRGFLCFRPEPDTPAVVPPPCLAGAPLTFGSFNVLAKLSPEAIELWARILCAVPGSRLLLKTRGFADASVRQHIEDTFAHHGIARERVTLIAGEAGYAAHLQRYGEVDVALDPFPYNGTTTTCEALWMGVPVIAQRGDRHCGRVGASLLHRVGLDELVADSPAKYLAKAIELAGDHSRLASLRRTMRERMHASPLMDAAGFTRDLEAACAAMYGSAFGTPPAEVDVTDIDEELRLSLRGGFTLCVPNDPFALTPYVLLEQEDWFEDEIRFVRALLEPGMQAIDIGANYGLYTLSMARSVGATGHVWAFEPAAHTVDWLKRSVNANGFGWVEVLRAGLSDHSGSAALALEDNPELNRVLEADDAAEVVERITLYSLDDYTRAQHLPGVDFMKIDAEGQEAKILSGAKDFLTRDSPLVMFEIKHGSVMNRALVERFAGLGYQAYRLVPGIGILAPWDSEGAADVYQLNLFACKKDRARGLVQRGLLVEHGEPRSLPRAVHRGAWRAWLRQFSYAASLADANGTTPAGAARAQHLDALDCHAAAHDPGLPAKTRLGSLLRSLDTLRALVQKAPAVPRLQSLARVAWEAGQRQEASNALAELKARLERNGDPDIDEPFLCVCPEFDAIAPHGPLRNWCLAATIHQFERLRAYSSYWSEPGMTIAAVESLDRLGYLTPEMARRRQLIRLRHGLQQTPESEPLLLAPAEDNLNPGFWAMG